MRGSRWQGVLEGKREAREETVVVEYAGSLFRARKVNGSLLECPVCRSALFYSEKDLIRHVIGHAMLGEERK
jgi:hypothetical protein